MQSPHSPVESPNSMARFKDAKIQLQRALDNLITKDYLNELGKFAVDMVKLRTQLGYGVSRPGATRQKLKSLSPGYIAQRRKAKLNENTSATKSNLTKTGQLISSLDVKSASKGGIVIGPTGTRNDGLENAKVAEYVTINGRPFNNLSDVELKRIKDKVAQDLRASLKKSLAKLKK